MRLRYNSPVILTFTLLSTLVHLLNTYVSKSVNTFFTVPGNLEFAGIKEYVSIVSHVLGHADWEHLLGNFSLILLLGPILEEKYGSKKLLLMIVCTAIFTGLLNILIFETGLLGASGIVFMLILLSSITNYRNGDVPITFLLVVALYLGKEVMSAFSSDQVSQFGHIMGGIFGAIFGFALNKKQITEEAVVKKEPVKKDVSKLVDRAMETYDTDRSPENKLD